jgi:hypothetical protein
MAGPIRIANCSGFFGDSLTAAREMVEGGPIDVLTGDWLAELTMLILARTRMKRPGGGYAHTFVQQMEQVMGTCLTRHRWFERRRPGSRRLRRGRGRGGPETGPASEDRVRARRRPRPAHAGARRGGSAPQLRDRRADQGHLGVPHCERLSRLLGHRGGARAGRRHRDHRPLHGCGDRVRPGGLAPRLEPHDGTRWRARWRPAT